MDNRRYQELRTYCMADLGDNMKLPGYEDVMKFARKMGGDTGRIKREEQLARSLFQCHDLTTRERAAAHLLSVITNHRIATWQREPSPPNGQEPMPPLDKAQSDELARVTCDAVTRYAAFLPDRQAAVLLADCERPAPEQKAAPVLPAGGIPKGPHQGIPIKSRYTIAEAGEFIANATGKTVTLSEVLDWGSQRLYKIYLPIKWGTVRQVGKPDIARVEDSIVEIRLSSGQAAILGKGERVGLTTCWRDGIECNFVRQRGVNHNPHIPMRAGSNWKTDTVYFDAAGLVLLGAELAAFTASIAKPAQTATAADTTPESQVAPVAIVALDEPAKAGPLPLATGDIAFCFAGLRWETEEKWKKPLGDKPIWLAACVVAPAKRGVSETRWNPVCIGAALVRAGHAKPNNVRAKFQTQPLLTPWLDEWKTYEADNFDSN